ncbi:MAG: 30S ribosomal protein S8 [Candidatus Atribacteria bacterium]|nr:30S ribosomal protein S8 [Candidatus Atribacteria bacterium]
MSVTDPISDMLTRVRNASKARLDTAVIPSSKLKTEIAKILLEEGYINSLEVSDGENINGILKIYLKYGKDRKGVIEGLKRISKPGLRVYAEKENIPRVLGGLGTVIISTSQGIMTGKKAKKLGIGGEIICYIW